MKLKFLLLFLSLTSMQSVLHAQDNISISGTISDSQGPLPGASVVIKGSTTGTQTDFDGNYVLDAVPSDATLEISYIGYANQSVPV
ncbi:hypothetical protein LCGC14_2515770, partial [marine sediment metagenome]